MLPVCPSMSGGSLRVLTPVAAAGAGPGVSAARDHTVIALSHDDFTAYELDPATDRIVNCFTAATQPQEAVVTPDGKSLYVKVRARGDVEVIDLKADGSGTIAARYPAGGTPFGGTLPPKGSR